MLRKSLFAFVLAATSCHATVAWGDLAPPSSNLLFQLEKQNRSRPWLRITTDSARIALKARDIDEQGLSGFTVPAGVLPPPEPLTWSQIERIDEVVTRAHAGRVTGAIAIGLAGAGLGNMIGAPDNNGGPYALVGLVAFGSLGGWLGGWFGGRYQHERNWYMADATLRRAPRVPPMIAAPAESGLASVTPPSAGVEARALAPGRTASRDVIRVARRIGKDTVFRVKGDFGRFQGFAAVAGPEGFEGLSADPRAGREWAGAAPPERIPWEAIDEVQMRGGRGMSGALVGAATFATFGALLGAAAVAVADPSGASPMDGALVGAGLSAPVGAALGGGFGALSRRWVVVYRRP